ncbi:Homeodomain-like [Parasponia andersonii]|uniref:Homeodomain-like n=1 Tax=Parasponia andersonii TaxID=3476 RepID=A0A2P5CJ08_PARAD|nr:Homeodomain-like [Parasponia andersonii]
MQNMQRLLEYVSKHVEGKWTSVPKRADSIGCRNISLHFQDKSHLALLGLRRSGRSCSLRWINFMRVDLKDESFTPDQL